MADSSSTATIMPKVHCNVIPPRRFGGEHSFTARCEINGHTYLLTASRVRRFRIVRLERGQVVKVLESGYTIETDGELRAWRPPKDGQGWPNVRDFGIAIQVENEEGSGNWIQMHGIPHCPDDIAIRA